MIFFFIFTLMLVFMIFLVGLSFMEYDKMNEASESPFECGFEPISFSRTPFSMHFFSITIIFLIFDLEIVILIPLVGGDSLSWVNMLLMSLIIFFLLLGVLVEWFEGSLEWAL